MSDRGLNARSPLNQNTHFSEPEDVLSSLQESSSTLKHQYVADTTNQLWTKYRPEDDDIAVRSAKNGPLQKYRRNPDPNVPSEVTILVNATKVTSASSTRSQSLKPFICTQE